MVDNSFQQVLVNFIVVVIVQIIMDLEGTVDPKPTTSTRCGRFRVNCIFY